MKPLPFVNLRKYRTNASPKKCILNVESRLETDARRNNVCVIFRRLLTLSVPVVLLNSPNLSPYFSLNKFERILLLMMIDDLMI